MSLIKETRISENLILFSYHIHSHLMGSNTITYKNIHTHKVYLLNELSIDRNLSPWTEYGDAFIMFHFLCCVQLMLIFQESALEFINLLLLTYPRNKYKNCSSMLT